MSTLIGTYEYVLHSGDMTFLTANWAGILHGINFISAKIDTTGMLDVTATPDWGRTAPQGGHNTDRSVVSGADDRSEHGELGKRFKWSHMDQSSPDFEKSCAS
jgi:hypothetical protein